MGAFDNKYPYTDFHELNLDWFLAEFKKVTDKVTTLDATVKQFTDFVTNYFDNLDVQEEINKKLDAMAADGSLSALIQPLFDEYKVEIDEEIADQNHVLSTQNSRLFALEGRMDAFSSLTEGSTTGDAELMDIRVSYDGDIYPTAGDAVRGQISDIYTKLDSMDLVECYNLLNPDYIDEGHFYGLNGVKSASASYDCTDEIIDVEEGDVLRFHSSGVASDMRYVTAYDSDGNAVTASGSENVNQYTVPSGITGVRISYNANYNYVMLTKNNLETIYQEYFEPYYVATEKFLDKYAIGKSNNLLDRNAITANTIIRLNGSTLSNTTYDATDYIPVNEGNEIQTIYLNDIAISMRYVTAYTADKVAVSSLGSEYVTSYTVPAKIKYIRITADKRYLPDTTTRINYNGTAEKYVPYFRGTVNELAEKNCDDISALNLYPISTLPSYFINNMKYKPLGELSKGYICLVSDDGLEDIATYTIPMLITKDVPCTFAVFSASEVWTNYTATVVDAVQNHGCEIAQHGGKVWTSFDEFTLNDFFDKEKVFFDSIGLTPYGAVCPAHEINDMIRVVAGGRFGCLRTGYADGVPFYKYNDSYYNGPRSNMNGLTSQSSLDGDLDQHKVILDYVKANHGIRIIHWHENELTDEMKAQLEGIIDYAKSIGLEFITLKDIPTII